MFKHLASNILSEVTFIREFWNLVALEGNNQTSTGLAEIPSTNFFQNKSMIEEHKELIRNQENSNEFYRPFDENHSNYNLDIVRNNNQDSSRISTHSMEPARGTGWNINKKLEIDSISSNIQSWSLVTK